MKCSLGISDFLEELSRLSLSGFFFPLYVYKHTTENLRKQKIWKTDYEERCQASINKGKTGLGLGLYKKKKVDFKERVLPW